MTDTQGLPTVGDLILMLIELPLAIEEQERLLLSQEFALSDARDELLTAEDLLVQQGADGPIDGKNERTREAQLRDQMIEEHAAVTTAERAVHRTKLELRTLQARFSATRAIARLLAVRMDG
jgi:hypothetical protein